ncbi:MAG: hypothetical protein AAF761_04245, partial [Pseudomonadota bacterium]
LAGGDGRDDPTTSKKGFSRMGCDQLREEEARLVREEFLLDRQLQQINVLVIKDKKLIAAGNKKRVSLDKAIKRETDKAKKAALVSENKKLSRTMRTYERTLKKHMRSFNEVEREMSDNASDQRKVLAAWQKVNC